MFFQLVIVAQLMPQIVAAKHPVPATFLSFVFAVFLFVFVSFICLSVCVCLFICVCLYCHCCQIFSIYLVDITNEFRWTSSSFGSCVLDTTPVYSLSQQVFFVPTFITIIIIIIMSLLISMFINIIVSFLKGNFLY